MTPARKERGVEGSSTSAFAGVGTCGAQLKEREWGEVETEDGRPRRLTLMCSPFMHPLHPPPRPRRIPGLKYPRLGGCTCMAGRLNRGPLANVGIGQSHQPAISHHAGASTSFALVSPGWPAAIQWNGTGELRGRTLAEYSPRAVSVTAAARRPPPTVQIEPVC